MNAGKRYVVATVVAALMVVVVGVGASVGQEARTPAEDPSRGMGSAPKHELVRELAELRTRNSRTYVTANGGRVHRQFAGPVNFRDGESWRAIDNRLEPAAAGRLRNKANRYDVELPHDIGAAPVRVAHGERSVAFRLKGAQAQADAADQSATYTDALPNVDVRYDALADAVKETVILRSRDTPREFRFDLDLSSGLTVHTMKDGGLEIRDQAGTPRFAIPTPVAWDEATKTAPVREPVSMTYNAASDELVLKVDDDWVSDPDRRFPVSIDPYVGLPTDGRECTLSARADEQNDSFCWNDFLEVGKVGDHNHTAVLDFDAAENLPEHITVQEAWAGLYVKSRGGTGGVDVAMHPLTRPFVAGQATWLNAANGIPWTTPGGDYAPLANQIKWFSGANNPAWSYWPMPDQAQRWADGEQADYGLLLRPQQATPTYGVVFSSAYDTNPDHQPYFDTYFEPIMGEDAPFSFVDETVGGTRSRINIASGRLTVGEQDAVVSEGGPGFTLQRFYNSADERNSALEQGWKLPPSSKLWKSGNGDVSAEMPSGTWLRFPARGDGTFDADRFGTGAILTATSTGYTLQEAESGDRYLFDTDGRLVRRERTGVTGSVVYSYDTSGRLKTVTDAAQGVTTLTYNAAGHLASATLPGGSVVSYSVSTGRLRSRTVGGATTSYSYNSAGLLSRIASPAGTTKFEYDQTRRVTSVTRVTDPASDSGPTSTLAYQAAAGFCSGSAGQTVVARGGVSRTYCWNGSARVTKSDAPVDGRPATGFDSVDTSPIDLTAGDEYLCAPNAAAGDTYCGEDPPPDPDASTAFSALAASTNVSFGIADNNRLPEFNIFDNASFQTLGVRRLRRTIPWNIALVKGPEYDEYVSWVQRALSSTPSIRPVLSVERCRSTFVRNGAALTCEDFQPTRDEYKAAILALLSDPVLGQVEDFTAWNEPNNYRPDPAPGDSPAPIAQDNFYQPTRDAELTGRYWYDFWTMCRASQFSCTVAAGDFLDARMQNVTRVGSDARDYYLDYRRGMYNARPERWAWHAYYDGERTLEISSTADWWSAFRAFAAQTQSRNATQASPSIWLTEQGATRLRDAKLTRISGDPDSSNDPDTLREPISAGAVAQRADLVTDRLTRSDNAGLLGTTSRILRFFYYQVRGDSTFDSGLLTLNNAQRGNYYRYRCLTAPSTAGC